MPPSNARKNAVLRGPARARERARLRDYAKSVRCERRMPTILARQLIIKKVDKKKLHGQLRRLVYGLFMTESDELFRVVVLFL